MPPFPLHRLARGSGILAIADDDGLHLWQFADDSRQCLDEVEDAFLPDKPSQEQDERLAPEALPQIGHDAGLGSLG